MKWKLEQEINERQAVPALEVFILPGLPNPTVAVTTRARFGSFVYTLPRGFDSVIFDLFILYRLFIEPLTFLTLSIPRGATLSTPLSGTRAEIPSQPVLPPCQSRLAAKAPRPIFLALQAMPTI